MSRNTERHSRRRQQRTNAEGPGPGFELLPGEGDIRREKEKARQLRHSVWWTKKIREGVCHYCRREVGREHLTMDHVLPLSRGGMSRKGNIVPACKECNNRKKYLIPLEWQDYLRCLSGESELE